MERCRLATPLPPSHLRPHGRKGGRGGPPVPPSPVWGPARGTTRGGRWVWGRTFLGSMGSWGSVPLSPHLLPGSVGSQGSVPVSPEGQSWCPLSPHGLRGAPGVGPGVPPCPLLCSRRSQGSVTLSTMGVSSCVPHPLLGSTWSWGVRPHVPPTPPRLLGAPGLAHSVPPRGSVSVSTVTPWVPWGPRGGSQCPPIPFRAPVSTPRGSVLVSPVPHRGGGAMRGAGGRSRCPLSPRGLRGPSR